MEKVFKWRSSTIAYEMFGHGPVALVCFHGYGQDKTAFRILRSALEDLYTVYSIDLPYHGNTVWKERQGLDQDELRDLIINFLREIGSDGPAGLLGYSIGGNYVLGLVEKCPELVKEVWLMAADGLRPKPGFYFLTKTILGRWIFKGFIRYPQPVFFALRVARFTGILPERVVRFFRFNIETYQKRLALYERWRSVSRIRGNLSNIRRSINEGNIPIRMIFGKKDGVISYRFAEKFAKGLKTSQLTLTDQGHQLLDETILPVIDQMLKEQNA